MPVKWSELTGAIRQGSTSAVRFEPEAAIQRVAQMEDLFAPILTTQQKLPAS
jgi:bifunctional non-homologous end joining protein LigD